MSQGIPVQRVLQRPTKCVVWKVTFLLACLLVPIVFSAKAAIPGSERWKTNVDLVIGSPALSASGALYLCSLQNLSSVDAATGQKRWSVPFQGGHAATAVDRTTAANGGVTETVYVCSINDGVRAYDGLTGTNKWTRVLPCDESPVVSGGDVIYVTAQTGVMALRKSDGSNVWTWPTPVGEPVLFAPALGPNGTLYLGSLSGKVYALSATHGDFLWSFQTGGFVVANPAIGKDGTIYIGSYDHKLYALDGTSGLKRWSFETGDRILPGAAVGPDGTVYVGSLDHKFYAVDGETGVKKWEFEAGDFVNSAPALAADGTIYFGSNDRKLYALNAATGLKLWEFSTGDQVDSAPNIGPDGTVYFVSRDLFLYALAGNSPMAAGAWPCSRHDSAQTGRADVNEGSTLTRPAFNATTGFTFVVKGPIPTNARVEFSTNLVHWIHLKALSSLGPEEAVADPDVQSSAQRFYRMVAP